MKGAAPSRLTRKQLDLAGGLTLAVLTVAAYLVIVAPVARARSGVAELHAQVDDAREAADLAQAVSRQRLADLQRVESALEAMAVQLEPASRLNRRVARVLELAVESGLIIHETQSGHVTTGARFDTIPITVRGAGSYPSCAGFLHRLSVSVPDIAVTGFELTGNPRSPGADASFRFDLSWFAAPTLAAAE